MITDFALEGATIYDLLQAINAHLKKCGIEAEDRDFGVNHAHEDYRNRNTAKIPERKLYRWLVSFVVEGNSEGYYIHVGAVMSPPSDGRYMAKGSLAGTFVLIPHEADWIYKDFGHAKCYSAEQAYQIATEAQRFLTAAAWN